MSIFAAIALILLAVFALFGAYMDRLYSEFGKILSREVQENLDIWEQYIEPRLGMPRERAALSAAILSSFSLGLLALEIGAIVFDRDPQATRATGAEIVQGLLGVILAVVFLNRVFPHMLFSQTRGYWARPLLWPIRLMLWLVQPVALMASFFLSIASLAEPPAQDEEEPAADVEALLEAGEEGGILEESDRELVRSAVEFGDKLVREVMTPRPKIFAVVATMTIEQFLEHLRHENYSRVPVFERSLDNIIGIALAHDLLQIADDEAAKMTVASIVRPVAFVPETKRGNELLREMQREKQHMRIVIDEYGGVSGLITIDDLLQQIVGTIGDEHDGEEDDSTTEPQHEESGTWLVPGSYPVDRMRELAGEQWHPPEEYEAQTLGGMVSETEGRIPHAGEVVMVEGLRIEVVVSTDRHIELLRVSPLKTASEEAE